MTAAPASCRRRIRVATHPIAHFLFAAAVAAALAACGGESTAGAALCRGDVTAISAIQGSDSQSPELGNAHVVRGVVTAAYRGGDRDDAGYFLQAPPAGQDSDPRTSEGLFVLADDAPAVGTLVAVRGEVAEIGELPHSQTALVQAQRSHCGKTTAKPEPATLELPGPMEPREGMLVRIEAELTVSDVYSLGRAGRMMVAAGGMVFTPTEQVRPGPRVAEIQRRIEARTLVVDDASGQDYPERIDYLPHEISLKTLPRVGDRVTGMVGVLDGRGEFRLHAVTRMQPLSRQPEQRFSPPAGHYSIATLNLLNYFNGDGVGGGFPTERGADSEAELERQRSKLVLAITGMGLPDILALQELENDGYGPNSAIADLVAALNRRIRSSRDTYAYVAPEADRLGEDRITVGLIYRRDKVRPLGPAVTTDDAPFDRHHRPPLAQTFEVLRTGEVLTVVAVHLKSKRCNDPEGANRDLGDGQGCYNAARVEAAEALAGWAAGDPTGSGDPDVLLIGDFNAYSQEDPIRALQEAGYVDLVAAFHDEPQYSFVYRGQAGSLDHAMASPALAPQARGARIWHINAPYTAWLDYRLQGKSAAMADALFQASAVRSSDHDPLVVGFR